MNAMYEFEYVNELGHGIEFDLSKSGQVCGVVIFDEKGMIINDKQKFAKACTWAIDYIKGLSKMARTAFAEYVTSN